MQSVSTTFRLPRGNDQDNYVYDRPRLMVGWIVFNILLIAAMVAVFVWVAPWYRVMLGGTYMDLFVSMQWQLWIYGLLFCTITALFFASYRLMLRYRIELLCTMRNVLSWFKPPICEPAVASVVSQRIDQGVDRLSVTLLSCLVQKGVVICTDSGELSLSEDTVAGLTLSEVERRFYDLVAPCIRAHSGVKIKELRRSMKTEIAQDYGAYQVLGDTADKRRRTFGNHWDELVTIVDKQADTYISRTDWVNTTFDFVVLGVLLLITLFAGLTQLLGRADFGFVFALLNFFVWILGGFLLAVLVIGAGQDLAVKRCAGIIVSGALCVLGLYCFHPIFAMVMIIMVVRMANPEFGEVMDDKLVDLHHMLGLCKHLKESGLKTISDDRLKDQMIVYAVALGVLNIGLINMESVSMHFEIDNDNDAARISMNNLMYE